MLDYWTELARQNGFSGMKYAYQNLTFDLMPNRDDSIIKHFLYYLEADYQLVTMLLFGTSTALMILTLKYHQEMLWD